nr:hypothetical protein HmN_000028900 [Hymenolepis microstoma]
MTLVMVLLGYRYHICQIASETQSHFHVHFGELLFVSLLPLHQFESNIAEPSRSSTHGDEARGEWRVAQLCLQSSLSRAESTPSKLTYLTVAYLYSRRSLLDEVSSR